MSFPMRFSSWRRTSATSISSTHDEGPHDQTREDLEAFRPPSSVPIAVGRRHSVSVSSRHREPIRSYVHRSSVRDSLAHLDIVSTARCVREDTADLASYVLSDHKVEGRPPFLHQPRPSQDTLQSHYLDHDEAPAPITEVSEPSSLDPQDPNFGYPPLRNPLRRFSSKSVTQGAPTSLKSHDDDEEETEGQGSDTSRRRQFRHHVPSDSEVNASVALESTPLITRATTRSSNDPNVDLEGQKPQGDDAWRLEAFTERAHVIGRHALNASKAAFDPKRWNKKTIWQNGVVTPASCMPAVCVGLLLNILDALSYGMILFPLGSPIFASLGSAGISIFYVSTIVSQITFSTGSIFRGAVGSELIEVVPFFHHMAQKITDIVGQDDPDAVIATTITAYAISSMITGSVFYLTGRFKFGFVVGFIPRHILIGCIGGVGWFLVATGFEVSARMGDSLEYDLDTLRRLTQPDTLPLWICPLILAIVLFWGQAKIQSKYFLPLYILAIPLVFYFFVVSLDVLSTDALRENGWIFEGPPAGEPWWYFYTLYKFELVRWDAIVETIPAMLALTFFGILHVPINVPALALQSGEDHADLNKELKLHGYSNFLSGCLGGIQNYLVYANTVFFMRSGGDTRLAGYMLAVLTFFVMIIGPSLIGFIPVMMVGTLIFDLGFELLLEAIWAPRKKLKLAEFLTVIAIVLVMGIYDFVIGIGVGIILAFASLVIQTSRIPAIRGVFSGVTVTSTVRRNLSQQHYIRRVGSQIFIMKLTGYLFFGTIVSVEAKIRSMIDDAHFVREPIKFLILDLRYVTGLDYSAGEAFNTICRLLDKKDIVLVLSGIDSESQVGRSLRAVGLGSSDKEITMLPDLNLALESCENDLLKTLYARQEELDMHKKTTTTSLDVPTKSASRFSSLDPSFSSPRRSHLHEAAHDALTSTEVQPPKKWQAFQEPLRIMLQVFQGLSNKNEDFWFNAASYFKRLEYPAGAVLFRRGEVAQGFYLVEKGILRAEYELPQGRLCESIVAGTTLGELPFFSETERTATAQVERDCIVWLMDKEAWAQLQSEEPDIARELLIVSLKLTSERMSSITSYILTMAG